MERQEKKNHRERITCLLLATAIIIQKTIFYFDNLSWQQFAERAKSSN